MGLTHLHTLCSASTWRCLLSLGCHSQASVFTATGRVHRLAVFPHLLILARCPCLRRQLQRLLQERRRIWLHTAGADPRPPRLSGPAACSTEGLSCDLLERHEVEPRLFGVHRVLLIQACVRAQGGVVGLATQGPPEVSPANLLRFGEEERRQDKGSA
jgi:hypothetical protein